MMTDDFVRIRTLCNRFFDGDTTLAEEQELYAFFSKTAALPADLQELRPLFTDMAALPQAYADPLQPHVETLASPEQHCPAATTIALPPKGRRWMSWVAAAAVVLLIVGGALLLFRRSQPAVGTADEELVAYIYGEYTTDPAVVLAEMQTTMMTLQGNGTDVVEEQLKAMFDN